MRILFLVLFVVMLAVAPVYALNSLVMPQLKAMKQSYQQEGAVANNIARIQQN